MTFTPPHGACTNQQAKMYRHCRPINTQLESPIDQAQTLSTPTATPSPNLPFNPKQSPEQVRITHNKRDSSCIEGNGPYWDKQQAYYGSQSNNFQAAVDQYDRASSQNQIFKSLFGPDASQWPFSEDCLKRALAVRLAQEATKQEYYKVERLNRTMELMKMAVLAKVPGHLIPGLLGTPPCIQGESHNPHPNEQHPQCVTPLRESSSCCNSSNSPSPVRSSKHSRSRTISSTAELFNSQSNVSDDSQSNPMKNFKFGTGSSNSFRSTLVRNRTSLPPRHQLSPSRIGAHAISSLNGSSDKNRVDIRKFQHGKTHMKTLSLPNNVTIPETKPLSFSRNHSKLPSIPNLREIYIPELDKQPPQSYEPGKVGKSCLAEQPSVEPPKDLPTSSATESSHWKRRRVNGGSPLKELSMVYENGESMTQTEQNVSISSFYEDSNKTLTSSSPKSVLPFEPKTP